MQAIEAIEIRCKNHSGNNRRVIRRGSVEQRPDELSCARAGCQAENQPRERSTGRSPSNKIRRKICSRCAPRAMRMAISDTRGVTR